MTSFPHISSIVHFDYVFQLLVTLCCKNKSYRLFFSCFLLSNRYNNVKRSGLTFVCQDSYSGWGFHDTTIMHRIQVFIFHGIMVMAGRLCIITTYYRINCLFSPFWSQGWLEISQNKLFLLLCGFHQAIGLREKSCINVLRDCHWLSPCIGRYIRDTAKLELFSHSFVQGLVTTKYIEQ